MSFEEMIAQEEQGYANFESFVANSNSPMYFDDVVYGEYSFYTPFSNNKYGRNQQQQDAM